MSHQLVSMWATEEPNMVSVRPGMSGANERQLIWPDRITFRSLQCYPADGGRGV
jgi:hypothetical protein